MKKTAFKSFSVSTQEVYGYYPSLLFPKNPFNNGGKPKYSICLSIQKDSKSAQDIKQQIAKAVDYGIENTFSPGITKGDVKLPLIDGDSKSKDEFFDCYLINATNSVLPKIFDHEGRILFDKTRITSGLRCKASIDFIPYSHDGKNGVMARLMAIQFLDNLTDQTGFEDYFA